ncbi:putative cytochrome P450 [Sclerotinia borealis F-4128]|uniref:Putative cytochrome P450 n=1 Tax=Sclerotinia borealis (strain F-4128) TaxID=1432307 RepID=W9CQ15_SCLBF|nr:putative cytochrome P450 [Sclerotinia borealis F-4128]
MDGIQLSSWIVILALIMGAYFSFINTLGSNNELREPLAAQTSIPYIGHALGLMRSKFNYYVDLSHKTLEPILTVTLSGTKMYIVNSLPLIQSIQKQPKDLAFPPIEAKFANQICGVSPEASKILMSNVNGDDGNFGLSMESYHAMRGALTPGSGLDQMNRIMIQNVAASLDDLMPSGKKSVNIKLSEWLRRVVTKATTNSVYGPQNPFKEAGVQDSFWQFESQLMTTLVGFLPSVFARTGIAARARVVTAFERYFEAGGYKEASILMQSRYETGAKNGVSVSDIARYEVGYAIAILVNTAPAAFWIMFFLYSNPSLLQEIREELDAIMEVSLDSNNKTIRTLDITNVKASCPLLLSVYQESLRHLSMGTSVREVVRDTVLEGKWLLKKDSMIQMPSRIIHMDSTIWGSDVEEFNPRRFLKNNGKTGTQKRPNTAAFRTFGGGSTLCPGRHFATNEVLAVESMFVMRYDMKPAAGTTWSIPKTENTNVAAVIMEPDTDIDAIVSVREGFEDGRWAFGLRDSKIIFAVVEEDRVGE